MNKELLKIAEVACQHAKTRGAKEAGASVRSTRHCKTVVRDGKLEEIKSSESRSLKIRVFVNDRYGSHTTSDLEPKALKRFIDDAVEMTRFLMPDKHRALPEPRLYAGRSGEDLKLFDPSQAKVSVAERKRLAMETHDAARERGGDKVLSVGAGCSDSVTERVLLQTNGFADGERRTSFSLWADVSVNDAKRGTRPSDWAETGARHRSRLGTAAAVGREAARRALDQLGAEKIASCTLPLVIENRAVGRVLGGLLAPLNGQSLDQKRSCFDGKEGKKIAAALLSIIDEPLRPADWGSRRYDGEGITARRLPVIDKGVLKSFYIDTYYGRKLGRPPTTGRGSNLIFSRGDGDVDALCKAAGKAILVTKFIGGNSNSTTGDFSHGIGGFLIDNGARKQPVASMNLAGSHLEFWNTLTRLGGDPYPHSSRHTPSLLFKPILVAGK